MKHTKNPKYPAMDTLIYSSQPNENRFDKPKWFKGVKIIVYSENTEYMTAFYFNGKVTYYNKVKSFIKKVELRADITKFSQPLRDILNNSKLSKFEKMDRYQVEKEILINKLKAAYSLYGFSFDVQLDKCPKPFYYEKI